MSKTRKDWVEVYQESLEIFKPTSKSEQVPDDEIGCEIGTGKGKLVKALKVSSDFYSSEEIRKLGITCGKDCLLHKQNIIVNPEKLVLGNNVRIDGYCTISAGAGITIGDSVHIAGYVSLFGGAGIEIQDYVSIASGAKVYSISDDVMGRGLVGPCVPLEKRHLHKGKVTLYSHSVLAVNSVVMPGSNLSFGSTLMPFSVLSNSKDTQAYAQAIYSGVPAVFTKFKKPEFTNLITEIEDD